jgi:DNA-directed RNA polymerase subunit RPC12/RpoP
VLELPKMALGIYPFRCLDCRERFWINIWLFSKRKYAMCPRCVLLDVIPTDPRKMRLGIWGKLELKAGARGYRCLVCRHRFLSFRRAGHSNSAKVVQPQPNTVQAQATSAAAGK